MGIFGVFSGVWLDPRWSLGAAILGIGLYSFGFGWKNSLTVGWFFSGDISCFLASLGSGFLVFGLVPVGFTCCFVCGGGGVLGGTVVGVRAGFFSIRAAGFNFMFKGVTD